MDARLSEANIDLCRLAQDSRSVTCQEEPMTCAVDAVEARPVRVQSGGGHWACKVAGHADDLQPSGGHGRLRHRTASAKLKNLCVKRLTVKTVCGAIGAWREVGARDRRAEMSKGTPTHAQTPPVARGARD